MRQPIALVVTLLAGLALSAADLPYIFIQCDAGYCTPTRFDALLLVLVSVKAAAIGAVLGWLVARTDESIPIAFGIGSLAVGIEGLVVRLVICTIPHGYPESE